MVTALKHLELFVAKVNGAVVRENGALPVSKITKVLLPGVTTSSKGLLQEENDLLMVQTSDGSDPDTNKLMEKSIYDFSKPLSLGHIIKTKPYGLSLIHI